ncbi:MAG: hypothetical protein HYU64_03035 [Armatimonadetes bacterium]|nr:hypothetical protein [Armatimonadota bacterium]
MNHKLVKSLRVSRPDLPLSEATITIATSLIESGRNVVSFVKKGEGVLYYDSSLAYVTDDEDIQASDEGITLTREYLRATPYKDKKGEIQFRTFPIKGDVKAGEKILVRLTLSARRNYRYIVFEDPLPSGCEVVTRGEDYYFDHPYWWAREEVHDDKVAFFVKSLRAGEKQEFTYEMSAGVPGHYHVMPTRGYGMYRPDVRGNGKETSLTIRQP